MATNILTGALAICMWCLIIQSSMCVTPPVFYANVGDTVVLQCNNAGSGPYACFSTYTFQSMSHPMVMLNQSMKYQINMGSITISNVQATDAGFYACSQNCWQMKSDLISYYLQPMTMGQPVDTTRFWRPIPPIPSYDLGEGAQNQLVVVVSDERLYANKHSGLSDGEIAALVIGLFIALVIAIAIVTFLVIKLRRRKQRGGGGGSGRETIIETGGKSKNDGETGSIDYSTIDRNCDTRETTLNLKWKDQQPDRKPLSPVAKSEPARNPEINTRNMRGPQVVPPQDLPSIDINARNNASQRSQQQVQMKSYSITGSNSGSYNAGISGDNRAYQNQYEGPYDPNKSGSGLISPPPAAKPGNKIQFPTRTYQATNQAANQYSSDQGSQRYVSNETMHLNQIIKDAGFIADNVDRPYESEEDFTRQEATQHRTGYFNTRNPDSQYNYENNEDSSYRLDSSQVVDAKDTATGGVTVISARAPGKSDQETIIPSATNRSYQPQATKFSFQNQQQQQTAAQKPYMSYSQRVDCSTIQPLQLPPRNLSVNANLGTSVAKDSATDV